MKTKELSYKICFYSFIGIFALILISIIINQLNFNIMVSNQQKYWVSKEYISEIKNSLFHVWQTGVTHSVCIDAFEDESLAISYKDYLNQSNT